jgi:integrase
VTLQALPLVKWGLKMKQFNAENERVKRKYLEWEREANGKGSKTIDNIRAAIYMFEQSTKFKSFKRFNKDAAIAFKKELRTKKNQRTKDFVSKTYLLHTMRYLLDFFKWLSSQNGYKSKIRLPEIAYFNLLDKDIQIAQSQKSKKFPTVSQIERVIKNMPVDNEIQKRDRALIAFLIITGIRVNAVASIKLKHVFLEEGYIEQDPNEVKTKFGKRITTYFFPVGNYFIEIFVDWVTFLKNEKLFDYEAPLFPRTKLDLDQNDQFKRDCLDITPWQTTTSIRDVVKESFAAAGLRYYNPHSFRDTLVKTAYDLCKTPEEFKAWSQNLGHNSPLTTFTSYGQIESYNQGEIIKRLGKKQKKSNN